MTLIDFFVGLVGVCVILLINIPLIAYKTTKVIYGYFKSKVGQLVSTLKRV